MNTIVVSNIHREPKVKPFLTEFNPIYSKTPDYPHRIIGQFRCFHGHTNALRCYMTDETAVVFEDDAIPMDQYDWKGAIKAANQLVLDGKFDIVCLHGRGFNYDHFDYINDHSFHWMVPKKDCPKWVLGTLVYVIGEKAAKKFCASDFWLHGTNIDIFLWSENFKWCLLEPNQFNHSIPKQELMANPIPFVHGCGNTESVLENPRNREFVHE